MHKLFAIFIYLVSISAAAEMKVFEFDESGKLANGTEYSINILEEKYIPEKGEAPDDGSMWGIDGGYPSSKVVNFSININGEKVYLPKKAYFDLCHLSAIKIDEKDGNIFLHVRGGDAAGSYRAKFTFRKNKLEERIVRMGEFPDQVWEKITFHNEIWDNEKM